jgi:two-component system phosphate regulon sensor histidine kinase PhoR
MSAPATAAPLTRRLIDRYMMFGLACVFTCIALAVVLTHRGRLTDFGASLALVPLILLIIGGFVLRRTVRLNESIEEQLRQIAAMSSAVAPTLKPLADAEPLAVGWNTVLQHLHDQHTARSLEARLGEALGVAEGKRWRAVFNALGDGVAVCDRNDQVQWVNNAMLAMLGLEGDAQATGRNVTELLAESLRLPTAGLLQSSGQLTTELRKGAELSAGIWRVSRIPIIDGAIEGSFTLWSLRDITQQKLAEEMRNQFVFTATHELRTPLANIKAYAETLADAEEIDVDRQKGFYNIINSEATRLARFVDELLNVSQMEAGAVTVTRHETDVERLLGEVVETVKPQVEKKQLTFESHLPAKLPKLRIDKDKMVASLVNLLGNAVKYTPEQGTVRLLVEQDEAQLLFHVEDTGIGIAAEELPRICEKFFRSSDARVQNITGSGLGLAFSQEVARLHGGRITIKSEINKGSRFTLSLPLN